MKCFNHPQREAIGICYYCQRALCADCAREYPRGLACKGQCERAVELMLAARVQQLPRGRYLLKKKRSGRHRPLSPDTPRFNIASLLVPLIIAIVVTHYVVHAERMRWVIEIGLCGTLLALGLLKFLRSRYGDGGDR